MPTARRSRLPRKPTILKALRGTLHSERVNPNEPVVPIGIPEPPPYLGPYERDAWARFAEVLEPLGCVSPIDFAAFELLVYAQATSRRLRDGMAGKPLVSQRGARPELRAALAADRRLMVLLKRFGIEPGGERGPSRLPPLRAVADGPESEFA